MYVTGVQVTSSKLKLRNAVRCKQNLFHIYTLRCTLKWKFKPAFRGPCNKPCTSNYVLFTHHCSKEQTICISKNRAITKNGRDTAYAAYDI